MRPIISSDGELNNNPIQTNGTPGVTESTKTTENKAIVEQTPTTPTDKVAITGSQQNIKNKQQTQAQDKRIKAQDISDNSKIYQLTKQIKALMDKDNLSDEDKAQIFEYIKEARDIRIKGLSTDRMTTEEKRIFDIAKAKYNFQENTVTDAYNKLSQKDKTKVDNALTLLYKYPRNNMNDKTMAYVIKDGNDDFSFDGNDLENFINIEINGEVLNKLISGKDGISKFTTQEITDKLNEIEKQKVFDAYRHDKKKPFDMPSDKTSKKVVHTYKNHHGNKGPFNTLSEEDSAKVSKGYDDMGMGPKVSDAQRKKLLKEMHTHAGAAGDDARVLGIDPNTGKSIPKPKTFKPHN